jgi:hypothetical protein
LDGRRQPEPCLHLVPRISVSSLTFGWLGSVPSPTKFLAQLKFADQICNGDRTAVGLWEAVPPTALIAPFARMARSTNRSTHSMVIIDY